MPSANPQLQTLRLYAELLSRLGPAFGTPDTLAGTLTLTHGPRCSATGLASAVSIAGGTSLLIDPDPSTVKATFRAGGIDFLVTNLDEALRVLKNELRKHTPLSVALTADPAAVLAEMRERGVEPDLEVSIGATGSPSSLALHHLHLPAEGLTPHALDWLASRNWLETWLPTETTVDLRTLDVRLIDLIPDVIRLQWLRRIPNYHRPAPGSGRALWLTPGELKMLSSPQRPL